jgi:hypothetical protein
MKPGEGAMGIPEEDLPPRWIRDYGTLYDIGGSPSTGGDGGTGVKVDMPAMKDFAAALRENLEADYRPHAQKVFADMTEPPKGQLDFLELWWALEQHRDVQQAATDNVANQGNGALVFASAADKISNEYRSSDAYAAARMTDVEKYLGTTPAAPATTPPTSDPTDPAGDM